MFYNTFDIKIADLVGYANRGIINLSPIFQRGHVWDPEDREKLIMNMLDKKPIPAIFWYKEISGEDVTYNILDGKQRVESIMLFIGHKRPNLPILTLKSFFSSSKLRSLINFQVTLKDGNKKKFSELEGIVAAEFSEYKLPIIEIEMRGETELKDIISLFVDINQQGYAVSKFQIVKAMEGNNPLVKQSLELVGRVVKKGKDVGYKKVKNEFSFVLQHLNVIKRSKDVNSQVEKMWERIFEISIFNLTRQHSRPNDILNSFIGGRASVNRKQNGHELRGLRNVFRFIKHCYSRHDHNINSSALAKDTTHFYTMVTVLLTRDLMSKYTQAKLQNKLFGFSRILDSKLKRHRPSIPSNVQAYFRDYLVLSQTRTTDVQRRNERGEKFYSIIDKI